MNDIEYLAHIAQDGQKQTAAAHCRNSAKYASESLKSIGMEHTAFLAALLHDIGKFKAEFLEYLLGAASGQSTAKRGSVNHTFSGVRFVLERWHQEPEFGYSEITAELLSFAIGAHHGLFDCVDAKQNSGFDHRLTKEGIGYEESVGNFFQVCANPKELDTLFHSSVEEMIPLLDKISNLTQQEDATSANRETYFYVGLLARMLLSAVIEGDRRDTAEFMHHKPIEKWPEDMRKIWTDCLLRIEQRLEDFPNDTPLNQARRTISDHCVAFAAQAGGVYRLNVPTGGGKTLSSLRYAVAHAKKWNKSRLIFTSPLLSILDQNAKIIRDFVGDNRLILEHHSNVVEPNIHGEQLHNLELLTDTWEAPIIITTLVQLLNTIFSGKTSAIRRFHGLCNSVIVIDEVQTVPDKMLTLFNLAVNFLSEICGATIVLCSATQPSLETVMHPLLHPPIEIIPREEELWRVFKRTEIRNIGSFRLSELPQVIENSMADCNSLLVVCNKKDEALFLFDALRNMTFHCFHLSAAMCTNHRRETLRRLQVALQDSKAGRKKTICISTQVIEAGVDISFQQVMRFAAGMDSVIQAAGRCNRHAEQLEPAPVSIVQCTDEKLFRLEDIARGKNATIALLDTFQKNPAYFQNDLSENAAIEFYYRQLYNSMDADYQDDVIKEYGSIFHLLADNPKYADANCEKVDFYFLRQAFRLAGEHFQVFDQNTTDVLVPYGKGQDLRECLIAASQTYGNKDWESIRRMIAEAKEYSISLYQYQLDQLKRLGAVDALFEDSIYILSDGFYDEDTGFSIQKGTSDFWEV